MKVPKIFVFLVDEQSIQLVFGDCVLKRQGSNHQCEENDAQSEDVTLGDIVFLSLHTLAKMYLRSHISLPGSFVLTKIDDLTLLLKISGKPKVTDLHPQRSAFHANQDILQFEIAMRDALPMKVPQPLCNTSEQLPLLTGRKLMSLQIPQQRSFLRILENQDVLRANELFIHLITLKGNFLLISKSLNDILMFECFQDIELVFQMSLLLSIQRGDYLKHDPILVLAIREELGIAATADQREPVITHQRIKYYLIFEKKYLVNILLPLHVFGNGGRKRC